MDLICESQKILLKLRKEKPIEGENITQGAAKKNYKTDDSAIRAENRSTTLSPTSELTNRKEGNIGGRRE